MTVWISGSGDGRLAADTVGPSGGVPVLLLHGGGQSRSSWSATQAGLASKGYLVMAADLRGHGESDWAGGAYTAGLFADDVRHLAATFGRPIVLVGASLGGIAALLAVTEAPAVPCIALVLVDVTPRMSAPGTSPSTLFMSEYADGFTSLEEAADAVAAYLPHRPRPADTSGLARLLRQGDDGRWRWHWDPRIIRPGELDEELAAPARFEAAARAITAPTLLVRGSLSEVVSEEKAAWFQRLVPHAERVDVEGARHMVAGDANDPFSRAIEDFLTRVT